MIHHLTVFIIHIAYRVCDWFYLLFIIYGLDMQLFLEYLQIYMYIGKRIHFVNFFFSK